MPAFRTDSRCRVVGICGRSAGTAKTVAARLGIPKAYDDWRDLVADAGVAVVAVAVPPAVQPAIVEAAARAGKHVFCEKPIAADAAAAARMLDAVDAAGVVHVVDFLFPEIAAWRRARAELPRLGPLRTVALTWRVETVANRDRLDSWKLRPEDGGGALGNFVSHTMYYLEWMFGPVRRVAARLTPRAPEPDARVDAWLEFGSGLPLALSVATDAPLGSGHRLEVYGDEGALCLVNRSADYARGFELSVGTRGSPALQPVDVKDEAGERDGRVDAMGRIVRRFLDAVATGGAVTPNLRDGLRVQRLLDVLRRADASETWEAA